MTAQRKHTESGFILPFALVTIAGLSLISAVAFQQMARATDAMAALQRASDAEIALQSAEAETAFAFSTGIAAEGGFFASTGQGEDGIELALGVGPEIDPSLIWQGNGQARKATTPFGLVKVRYRDGAGHIPIDKLGEDGLRTFMQLLGVENEASYQITARILDYQDSDRVRRPLGAERADYSLFGAPLPTDSPLRTYEEFGAVLGFREIENAFVWRTLRNHVAFGLRADAMKTEFTPPELLDVIGALPIGVDPVTTLLVQETYPGERARFLLSVEIADGYVFQRAVDFERTAVAADQPFRRIWIYDDSIDPQERANRAAARAERDEEDVNIQDDPNAPEFQRETSIDELAEILKTQPTPN